MMHNILCMCNLTNTQSCYMVEIRRAGGEILANYTGRKIITTDVSKITKRNVMDVLRESLMVHQRNTAEINYLYQYYKGKQDILNRIKEVRPEINNKIVENRANEIVSFKTGYLMGEPIQYISRGNAKPDKINELNEYLYIESKAAKDKQLAEWFHICGTSYRMILPNKDAEESPFKIYTLDPRFAFVVYRNDIAREPIMAVKYIVTKEGVGIYSIYTETDYFEIKNEQITKQKKIISGIPIIEYPANNARLGAFETVLPLLDAINTVDSNRVDGIEQFVQAIMLFHNVDIDEDGFNSLREKGAIKFRDMDNTIKGEIKYLISELNQVQNQTLVEHLYQTVLTITGMPNRNGGSSTSDTGSAVIMRDGWSAAEARAKDSELMFTESEKVFLRKALKISNTLVSLDLKLADIGIKFTRRNYENITEKANVLISMLNCDKIHPELAFSHSGMFIDSEEAYAKSKKYYEERDNTGAEQAGNEDDSGNTNEGELSRSA